MLTKLSLPEFTPAIILKYVKSSKGRLGKTAGCFNILAKQKEESIQSSSLSQDSGRKVSGRFKVEDVALPSPLREKNIPNIHKPARKVKK